MIRTQIQLPDDYYKQLRERAHRQRTSVSELIRQGIVKLLDERASWNEDQKEKALMAIGRFSSGQKDTSEEHDRYLHDIFKS